MFPHLSTISLLFLKKKKFFPSSSRVDGSSFSFVSLIYFSFLSLHPRTHFRVFGILAASHSTLQLPLLTPTRAAAPPSGFRVLLCSLPFLPPVAAVPAQQWRVHGPHPVLGLLRTRQRPGNPSAPEKNLTPTYSRKPVPTPNPRFIRKRFQRTAFAFQS